MPPSASISSPIPSIARALRSRSWELALLWFVAPALVVLLAWRQLQLAPIPGFDTSWTAGLEMATQQGLTFGKQVVFTYGPLGFLSNPFLWSTGLGTLAFLYALALRFAFSLAVFTAMRRNIGPLAGFVAAVVVSMVDFNLLELVVLLIFAVRVSANGLSVRGSVWLGFAAGMYAGFELLNKVSLGVALAAMTAVLLLALPARRRSAGLVAAAAFAASVLVFWVASGQPLSGLPDYLVNSVRITTGWTPAVSTEAPGLGWQYPAAAFALILGLWAAWQMTSGIRRSQRAGIAILWIVFWFFAFKEGFVRHDSDHALVFFGAMLAGFLAFTWRTTGARFIGLAGAAALLAIALVAETAPSTPRLNPVSNLQQAVTDVHDLLSPSRRAALIRAGRATIESANPLDARALNLLRGHTVAVYPSEIALAWAYRLRWDPLPLLQSYNTYTTALDRIDADSLASPRAPERIVFVAQPGSYQDNRVLSFDAPLTSRAILCRYQELYARGNIAVLGLGPNRCTNPRLIDRVRVSWGEQVAVPAPTDGHGLVSLRIDGVGIGGLESLESLLFKPRRRFIQLNGGRPNRLVVGTATDGLPLRSGRLLDFKPPFTIAARARSVAVELGVRGPGGEKPITFSFYEQSFR